MRTVLERRPIVLIFLALSVALVAAQSNVAPQEPVHKLAKKELRSLLKNARTASDHHQLAASYRQEVERLMKRSNEHEQLAEAYANRTIFEPKTSFPGGLLRHCREFATDLAKAAKDAQLLAEAHQALAQKAPDQ